VGDRAHRVRAVRWCPRCLCCHTQFARGSQLFDEHGAALWAERCSTAWLSIPDSVRFELGLEQVMGLDAKHQSNERQVGRGVLPAMASDVVVDSAADGVREFVQHNPCHTRALRHADEPNRTTGAPATAAIMDRSGIRPEP